MTRQNHSLVRRATECAREDGYQFADVHRILAQVRKHQMADGHGSAHVPTSRVKQV